MKNRTKLIITLSVLSLITVVLLIGTQSYFNNKEIRFASDRCYEVGGMPKLESDFLHLNYSFSCHVEDNDRKGD